MLSRRKRKREALQAKRDETLAAYEAQRYRLECEHALAVSLVGHTKQAVADAYTLLMHAREEGDYWQSEKAWAEAVSKHKAAMQGESLAAVRKQHM